MGSSTAPKMAWGWRLGNFTLGAKFIGWRCELDLRYVGGCVTGGCLALLVWVSWLRAFSLVFLVRVTLFSFRWVTQSFMPGFIIKATQNLPAISLIARRGNVARW